MAINFPNSPTNNQSYTSGGKTYTYNSTKTVWTVNQTLGYDSDTVINLIDSDYVQARTAAGTDSATVISLVSTNSNKVFTVADLAALGALSGMTTGDQAIVTATSKLFMYNGTGWYLIATIANESPSAITGVDSDYTLATDGTAIVINAISTDPEGAVLTWSSSTSGLSDIATITQGTGDSSNYFTITPASSDSSSGGDFHTNNSCNRWRINGAVNWPIGFTLTFSIANSRYTSVLITAVNTSDNNNITDASSNSRSITVTGDATAGTFSPYANGGYSTYFGSSTNAYIAHNPNGYPAHSGSNFALPSGANADWTIECWVNLDAVNANQGIFQLGSIGITDAGSNGYGRITIHEIGGYIRATLSAGSSAPLGGSDATNPTNTQISAGEWMHVALVNDSGTISLYGNGLLAESVTDATDYSIGAFNRFHIGVYYSNTICMQGYLTDFRISSTARYTANFTPPTEAFTSDSDTILLTCHLPYNGDASSNSYPLYTKDNISKLVFRRYDLADSYSASSHGGSVYFDGNGDYLTIPSLGNSAVTDFTISFWMYPEDLAVNTGLYPRPLTIGNPSSVNGFILYLDNW